ncbi:helix-turn-helix domain-containing protein [Polaribacter litorisediminis]|uniref:helix-turn-helix domain-containing protein n=1 Tax=Polaribacter litorisediminis TaxID=1908341 RepID=UPI001CBC7465|nr:helix-turn-helix domain-containing protein [Polaribacter litorisediminis]UAM97857.1 helix-turn-helix domain-containing protein [Polaribacter litorisediminis]
MEKIDLSTVIGFITTFISLLLAFYIFSVASKNKVSNKLFASYLILNAVEYTGFFASLLFPEPNNLLVASRELSYLQMPIFYLYILSVCYSDFKLQWKHLWHITPYIIGNLVMTPRFYLGSTAEKIELFHNFNQLYESIFTHIALHLQSTIYLIAGFIALKKAQKIFLENYANSTIETYNWLFQLLLYTSILYFVAIIKNIFKFFGNQEYFSYSQNILTIVVLVVVCWYVLKALKYPNLFNGVDSKTKLTTEFVEKDQKHNIDLKEIKKLRSYMETEKPYLNPSLSIRNLAEEIKMNSRDLSVLINQYLDKHFFDFVNEYRIEEAKSILKNPEKKEITVLEILYEVGFNSKSSFNTAFKKHTGLTPTQFRKNK